MPVHTGKDSKGCFAQWGGHGKKYYYTCGDDAAHERAVKKANDQGRAAHAHGYTGNADASDTAIFQCVVSNLKPLVRHDSMEGRDWIVAPAQMLTEGVHVGSDGPIYYPAEELAKLPSAWNYMPVVVYHPVENGAPASARTPEQLTRRKIGVLMNTKWDAGARKLGTETWLDPARIASVDNRVAEAIEKNEVMELSTGLFMSLERKEGVWNGEEYIGIAREIQPDHLALLPDLKGACSIADGAGFLRVNEQNEERIVENAVDVTDDYIRIRQKDPGKFQEKSFRTIWISKGKGIKAVIGRLKGETTTVVQSYLFVKDDWSSDDAQSWVQKHKTTNSLNALILNEISHEETRRLLQSAVRENDEQAWIEEVHDDFFIYETAGRLYKQSYSVGKGIVSFVGLSKLVERKVSFVEVTGLAGNNDMDLKGAEMDNKKKVVDALISNERTSWTEEHRKALMALDDAILTNMAKDVEEMSKPPVGAEKAGKAEDGKVQVEANPSTNPLTNAGADSKTKVVPEMKKEVQPETMEQYIAKAPPEIRESLRMSVNAMNGEKARLIKAILANEACVFTEAHLKTMDLQMLQAIARLATPPRGEEESSPKMIPLYLGQGDTPAANAGKMPDPLPLPTMNFGKEGEKKTA